MPYDPRYHQRTSNLEDEIAGYDEVVVKQQRTHRQPEISEMPNKR